MTALSDGATNIRTQMTNIMRRLSAPCRQTAQSPRNKFDISYQVHCSTTVCAVVGQVELRGIQRASRNGHTPAAAAVRLQRISCEPVNVCTQQWSQCCTIARRNTSDHPLARPKSHVRCIALTVLVVLPARYMPPPDVNPVLPSKTQSDTSSDGISESAKPPPAPNEPVTCDTPHPASQRLAHTMQQHKLPTWVVKMGRCHHTIPCC